jgi:hypothetical protein
MCPREGAYRLPWLAAKYSAEIRMPDLLGELARDCKYWSPRHPGIPGCGAYFRALAGSPRPPDLPPAASRLKVVR